MPSSCCAAFPLQHAVLFIFQKIMLVITEPGCSLRAGWEPAPPPILGPAHPGPVLPSAGLSPSAGASGLNALAAVQCLQAPSGMPRDTETVLRAAPPAASLAPPQRAAPELAQAPLDDRDMREDAEGSSGKGQVADVMVPAVAAAAAAAESKGDDPTEQHPSPLPACLRPYLLRGQVATTPAANSGTDSRTQQAAQQLATTDGASRPEPLAGRRADIHAAEPAQRVHAEAPAKYRAGPNRGSDAVGTLAAQQQSVGNAAAELHGQEDAVADPDSCNPSSNGSSAAPSAPGDNEPEQAAARPPLHARQPTSLRYGCQQSASVHRVMDSRKAARPIQEPAVTSAAAPRPPQPRTENTMPGLPVHAIKQVWHSCGTHHWPSSCCYRGRQACMLLLW